jgi:hypothetical protein
MTDYYSEVEDAVIALVKNHLDNRATYFKNPDKQAVKSNDTILTEGFDYFFITYPASFPTTSGGTGVVEVTWNLGVEIFVLFSTPPNTWAKFKAFRGDIFNLFNVSKVGRTLDRTNGVKDVLLTGESEPVAYSEEGLNDPIFYSQRMQLSVFYKVNRE